MRGTLGFGEHFGRVQEGLGGDATAIEAHAAELLVLLDEDDFLAFVGRVKRRCVSAGSGANDHDVCLDGFHEK